MSDWNEVTPEQLALLRSCGPDERVYVYGDDWIKMPTARIEQLMEHAFRAAYGEAAQALGEAVASVDIDDIELGQTFLRVTLTGASGRQCAGVGAIPDPRPQ